MKEEPNRSHEYCNGSTWSDFNGDCKDFLFPSIKVRNVASISLKEMERLDHGHGNLLENPFRRLHYDALLLDLDEPKKELPRPSNAVATVLQQQDTNCQENHVYAGINGRDLLDNSEFEMNLLKPSRIEDMKDYLKKNPGSTQEVRFNVLKQFMKRKEERLQTQIKVEDDGTFVKKKKKAGRPRKNKETVLPANGSPQANGSSPALANHCAHTPKRKVGRPRKRPLVNKVQIKKIEKVPIVEEPEEKPMNQYFSEEILMTRLRNKRL